MDENIKLHNINKDKIKIYLAKILDLHDKAIAVIKKYIEEFQDNPEFKERVDDFEEFAIEIEKGRDCFAESGVDGIANDIESFPYECTEETLPLTVSIGGTRFWKLYSKIQSIAFEEVHRNLPRTEKTLWAFEIIKTICDIRDYYYQETIPSQLSEALLAEFNNCYKHYLALWDLAISKIDEAITICKNGKEEYMIPNLQECRDNLALHKKGVEMVGVPGLIETLRRRPITDLSRPGLGLARGMDELLGVWRYQKKDDIGRQITDAVDNICDYFDSGFGFKEHKRFSYEKLMAMSREREKKLEAE